MWILTLDTQKGKDYRTLFWSTTKVTFNKAGNKSRVPKKYQNTKAYIFLTKIKFESYLNATPNDLIAMHVKLFTYIMDNYPFVQTEWEGYKEEPTKYPAEYAKITDDEVEAIKHIFNYKSLIDTNKDFSYAISALMETNTCTYCNRQYTLTISDGNKHLIRPEFDHWFSQSHYPDLALSYFNLIPSCKFCNSSLKHDKETSLDKHIHPYLDNDVGFKFTYVPLGKDQHGVEHYGVDCKITTNNSSYKKRVEHTLELFKIKETYNAHSELELKDLIELAKTNPNDYIDTLTDYVLKNTNLTKEKIYRMIFGIESNHTKYINRPFSKFKMDIIKKLHDDLC